MLLSRCVHVAFQNVSRTWCFPTFLRMLLPCCVPRRFKNLVLSHFLAHVALMLRPWALRNSVKQGRPTRVSPSVSSQGVPQVGSMENVTNKYCLCSSPYVSVFGFVGFILFSCCVHVAFQTVSRTWCFPRFCTCCFRVASMLLSKTFQKPGVFPGFCVCCFHVVSMLLSRNFQGPCVFPGFCTCCFHVASMLLSKMFEESGALLVFCACCFMLRPFVFQNVLGT